MLKIDDLSKISINDVGEVHTPYTEQGTYHVDKRQAWAICLKIEGETVYRISGNKYISNAANVILIPQDSTFDYTCKQGGRVKLVEFDANLKGDGMFSFPISDYVKFLSLFEEIDKIWHQRKRFYQLKSVEIVYKILNFLMDEYIQNTEIVSKEKNKIRPAVNYIIQNYGNEISNDILANFCGMSTQYFRKIFCHVYGLSPMKYVLHLRLDIAKQLLVNRYGTVSNIALKVGFSDVYHFSKMFKNYTGVSPSEYSKKIF